MARPDAALREWWSVDGLPVFLCPPQMGTKVRELYPDAVAIVPHAGLTAIKAAPAPAESRVVERPGTWVKLSPWSPVEGPKR